ncbi:putative glycerophosphoryl diester phosphodiesterase 2 [Acorus calamus]|uniref:glycerophosphodiester phosphodiesterase n=1 Tax=Acorus calamus TaxID=4465 RepID=A0AAV9CIW8_ACOCL|nr:putative glycerophosphoryl diester phosphodiesterase 2 [Acorus calamus]
MCNAPIVIARGGFSGLFPDSSQFAYQFAVSTSLLDVVLFCDLQLTKDGTGICRSDLRLDNSTNIATVYPRQQKSYAVNGETIRGWFSIDFTADQLFTNVSLLQNIFSRSSMFDGSLPIMTVDDVTGLRPPQFWLNVQYNTFYKQHKLDVTSYVQKASNFVGINYISSPEIGFLKSLNGKIRKGKTKLIFRFPEQDSIEPTTNQKYSSLLNDFATIKSFATGILVPKSYIWPVGPDQYLQPHTTLVAEAHENGLEIFAYGFANDAPASYNYSYDPTTEYLNFIDNSEFSVDGVLTDFPSTASESIACLAHNKNNSASIKGRPLIITHNGASGVFAGCTDLAYQQAVQDGADVIDCSVQMSKDGVAFCLNSADLASDTTVMATFMSRATTVPEIQKNNGVFSFDLTWTEIQSLKPMLTSPISETGLARNPANKNSGKFMKLSDFLDFAKDKNVLGLLINIENAAYLASKKGLDIVSAVITSLDKASYDNQTTQRVLIQSDDTSVLSEFKRFQAYERVLSIDEAISDAKGPAVEEVKVFAEAVRVGRSSVVSSAGFFLSGFTDVVERMHGANVSVYVSVLRNEFTAIAFDFFSDPVVEIATYVGGLGVNGLVTEFPATASAYFRSPCADVNADLPYTILPAQPGSLLALAPSEALPPAEPPAPVLTVADVVDPPLPPVAEQSESLAPNAAPASGPRPSGSVKNGGNIWLGVVVAAAVAFIQSLSCH